MDFHLGQQIHQMAPRSRGIERAIGAAISPSRSQHICRSCRQALSRRSYAIAATAQAPIEVMPLQQHTPVHPSAAEYVQPDCPVLASVVLSRPPLITPHPHPFETAYHLYQRRLNERLVLPFTQYFYYKRGTPAFEEWRRRKTERGGVAGRDIGKYNAYTKESWNDEVLNGDDSGSPQTTLEQLVDEEGRAPEFTPPGGDSKTSGLKRETDADRRNDRQSLERSLSRTLYLLVWTGERKQGDRQWIFPQGPLQESEGLKEAAKRVLGESCGLNMNTWFVGAHPIGHLVKNQNKEDVEPYGTKAVSPEFVPEVSQPSVGPSDSEKTFFMKARIFAGQADVQQEVKAYEDFEWLTKDEIKKKVAYEYWTKIKDMLVAQ